MGVNGAFRKIMGIARWVVRFVEEVDRGIAVGHGYEPVGKNIRRGRGAPRTCGAAGRGERAARGRVRAHRAGRRGTSGRA